MGILRPKLYKDLIPIATQNLNIIIHFKFWHLIFWVFLSFLWGRGVGMKGFQISNKKANNWNNIIHFKLEQDLEKSSIVMGN